MIIHEQNQNEEKIIEAQMKILPLEKLAKFQEIWNNTKSSMKEKLTNQQSLLEIVIRGCCFIANCDSDNEEDMKPNKLEKFMIVEANTYHGHHENNNNPTIINFNSHHDKILNLNDFMKQLTNIISEYNDKSKFAVVSEIIKDFSFSRTLFKKCGDLLNLFFDSHCNYFQKVKHLIWSIFIYSRKKLLNNSRNVLDCLPMLITAITIVLHEIDSEKFPQDLIKSAKKENLEETISSCDSGKSYLDESLKIKMNELILLKLITKTFDHMEVAHLNKIKKDLNDAIKNEEILKPYLKSHDENENGSRFSLNFNLNLNLRDEISINTLAGAFKVLYNNKLKIKNFDERIFLLNNNSSDCSPMKFTPFKRQKILNTNENIFDNVVISRRKLAFEMPNSICLNKTEDNNNNVNGESGNMKMFGDPLKGIDIRELTKKISESVKMTPCTRVIVMDKWVKDYIRYWDVEKLLNYENLVFEKTELTKNQLQILPMIKENLHEIKRLFNTYHINNVTKFEDIEKLILKIIYSLILRDERIFGDKIASRVLCNKNFLKSVIVIAVEIILFIENVELIYFYKLANAIKLDLYEFWKIINPFARVDLTIPSDIRLHFQEMEIQLNSFMIFKKPSSLFKTEVEDFLKNYILHSLDSNLKRIEDMEFNNQSLFVYQDPAIFKDESLALLLNNLPENSNISNSNLKLYQNLKAVYIFLRRILNYSIFLNKKISEILKLSTEAAKESEQLFKKILTYREYFDVLYDKHIDQIIVCCIIAILKYHNIYDQKNYINVLEAYEIIKPDNSKENINTLFYKIIDRRNNNEPMSIIDFYNKIFIEKVEKIVKSVCGEEDESEMLRNRKRKFSLPEAEMRKSHFEDETAFMENTIMYEPLQKTVFLNENTKPKLSATSHLLVSKSNFMAYSMHCSPLISKSVSNSALNRTPRSKRLKEIYSDYDISERRNDSSSRQNLYKEKIKLQNSSAGQISILNFERSDSLSLPQTPSVSGSIQSDLFFSESFNLDNNNLSSSSNNVNLNNLLTNPTSQITPEFNKVKK